MINLVIKLIMKLYNVLTDTRFSYMDVSDDIISVNKRHWLKILWHVAPTFILTIMTTVKFLPRISSTVNKQVQSDAPIVLFYAIVSCLFIGLLVGWAIEVYLELTIDGYRELKKRR